MTKNSQKFAALNVGVQATIEVFTPQKKTSNTSKLEFFPILWVILALLDPDPYSQNADLDPADQN
jgi:hypothetical protein